MEAIWSKWSHFELRRLSNIPKKKGVYQFRCIDNKGVPMVIPRSKNKDPDGIIYIGSSVNLRTRLTGFWRTIQMQVRSRHAAAWTYCSFSYSSLFPAKRVQFRYKVTPSMTTSEFDLLLAYLPRDIYGFTSAKFKSTSLSWRLENQNKESIWKGSLASVRGLPIIWNN